MVRSRCKQCGIGMENLNNYCSRSCLLLAQKKWKIQMRRLIRKLK